MLVSGLTTTVGTCPPPPTVVVPSSQVMNKALFWNEALDVMRGTKVASH